MTSIHKGLLAGIGILIFVCVVCAAGYSLVRAIAGPSVKIEEAARKVGVEPTLEGIAGYINESVKPEMSREQVEQALGELAPCSVRRDVQQFDPDPEWNQLVTCDDIWVKLESPLPFSACYTAEGKLVSLISTDADSVPIVIYAEPPEEP